ncbi:MAG: DUF456 domain-containing protein [Pirellulales bacterium]
METHLNALAAILFLLAIVLGWLVQLVGLPGNWLIVVAAALYAWLVPADAATAIGWPMVVTLVALAILGEVVEFVAGALGVTTVGGSRRGAVLAIVGSIVGGMVGIFVGVPIPIVGSLVGAVLFGGIGALAGAVLGETWTGRDLDASLEIGKAAFIGRLLGTAAKTIVCSLMVVVAIAAVIF